MYDKICEIIDKEINTKNNISKRKKITHNASKNQAVIFQTIILLNAT